MCLQLDFPCLQQISTTSAYNLFHARAGLFLLERIDQNFATFHCIVMRWAKRRKRPRLLSEGKLKREGDKRYSVGGNAFEQLGDIEEGTKTRALNHSESHSSTLSAIRVIGVSWLDHKTPDPIKPVLVPWMAWQIDTFQMRLWMTMVPPWYSSCWRHHGQVSADEGDSLRPWTGATTFDGLTCYEV